MYDKLDWGFIDYTLTDIGYQTSYDRLSCTVSALHLCRLFRMEVLWMSLNPREDFDKEILFLHTFFALCMEKLAQTIYVEVESGRWKPIKLLMDDLGISLCLPMTLSSSLRLLWIKWGWSKKHWWCFILTLGHNVSTQKTDFLLKECIDRYKEWYKYRFGFFLCDWS